MDLSEVKPCPLFFFYYSLLSNFQVASYSEVQDVKEVFFSDSQLINHFSCFKDFTLTENIFHAITHFCLDLFDFASLFLSSGNQIFACRDGGRGKVCFMKYKVMRFSDNILAKP